MTPALQQATGSTVQTQWADEQWGVPPIREQDRNTYNIWLQSMPALSSQTWSAIQKNWIAFLSATSLKPNATLAPNRKKVQFGSGFGTAQQQERQRFRTDRDLRRAIQKAIWSLFDETEALTERWPRQARLILNRVVNPTTNQPFQTFAAKSSWPRRRRLNAVWTALLCFLVQAADDDGALEEMGMRLSEDTYDDIMDIMQAQLYDDPEAMQQAVGDLCCNMIVDPHPTPSTNPLLWWMVVLVQSAVDPLQRDDYVSRGRFIGNILPMDMDICTRVEAVQHYAKVLVLNRAFRTWEPHPRDKIIEVGADLDIVDNMWLNADTDKRPPDDRDTRTCDSAAWREMLDRLDTDAVMYLGGQDRTVLGQVRDLLN